MGGPRSPPGRGGHGGAPVPLLPLLPLLLLLAGLPSHPVLSARQEGSCRFPSRWEGQWFQSGVRQGITIQHNRLSNKGRCVASDGEKYLVVDEKSCYRCVVIHEKHLNVLQYKETFCQGHTSLDQLCKLITGDALLFSMFRLGGSPVACPFRGPLAFTYNRGHGDCHSPMSSVEQCTQESRLLLRYQACPDVYGTESTVEELQCLATWKEGSARYLVGKVQHSHATSNEDRFRCFVYEQVSGHSGNSLNAGLAGMGLGNGLGLDEEAGGGLPGLGLPGLGAGTPGMRAAHDAGVIFRVAQSGDATCNGLSSDMEGSRTMTLYKAEATAPPRCKFPGWLSAHPHWHTLDYRRSYSLHQKNTSLKISNSTAGSDLDDIELGPRGGPRGGTGQGPMLGVLDPVVAAATGLDPQDGHSDEMRLSCTEARLEAEHTALIVAHFTMGCQSGFLCLQFYRRDTHVVELQTGAQSRRQEDACLPASFDRTALPYLTLVTSSPESKQCPYMGKFSVSGLVREERRVRSAGASAGASAGRWYRRALQEYNPEDDDGGLGEEDDEEEEGQYGVPRDQRRRPAGIDQQQEEARLFNKKKKQQEERDARIRADLAARQEWLERKKEETVAGGGGGMAPPPPHPAPGHRHASRGHHVKSHAKRSSGHKAVIEVAAAAGSDDEDEEDEDEEDDEDEDVEDEDMDGAIPDPIDMMPKYARPVGSSSGLGVPAGDMRPGRPQSQGRYRPHTPEYGNIDDLLEPSKSSTHWGTYPSDERLLELDSKSSSAGSSSKGSRGRRVRGLARHAGHAGHAGHHAAAHGGAAPSLGAGPSRRVRRGFGYEGGLGLPGLGSADPCDRDPGSAGTGPAPHPGRMHLYMGCSTPDTMEFRRDCGAPEPDVVSAYACHGRWEENGTHFLIASPLPRSSRAARRFCFVYRESQGVLRFSSSGASCQRGLGPGVAAHDAGHAAPSAAPVSFNVTSSGECVDTSAGSAQPRPRSRLLSALTALVITLALAGQR